MKPRSSNAKSSTKAPAEQVVKDIRRQTRRHFSAEDKIRIVLEGLRGEDSIAELCRKEGIAQSLYYTWSKEFMKAGKRRLAGDTARASPSTIRMVLLPIGLLCPTPSTRSLLRHLQAALPIQTPNPPAGIEAGARQETGARSTLRIFEGQPVGAQAVVADMA
ncbi:Transposase [Sphingomonas sp. OV641]|nr:Transposase [Sphingomonas sp. OV641]